MGLLLGFGIPLLYVMIAGGMGPFFKQGNKARCNRCSGDGYYGYCSDDHEFAAFFMALAWPVGMTIHIVSNKIEGPSRIEKRRAKELAEAKHEAEMAKLQAQRVQDLEIANGIVPSYPAAVKAARRRLGEDYEFGKD